MSLFWVLKEFVTSRTCPELSHRDICLCVTPTTPGDFFGSYPVLLKSLCSVKLKKFRNERKSCRSYEFRQSSTLLRVTDYVNVRFIPSRDLTALYHPRFRFPLWGGDRKQFTAVKLDYAFKIWTNVLHEESS